MKMKNAVRILLITCLVSTYSTLQGIDNAHFFKSPRFYGIHNRDTSKAYSKLSISYGYGSAHTGYDGNGDKRSALNIHGDENLLYLTTGVPKLSSVTTFFNDIQLLLNQSQANPLTSPTFGKLRFHGKFQMHDFNIDYRKNFKHGFFGEVHVPIRYVRIENIFFTDLSPTTGPFTQNTAEWIRVKNNLNTTLNAYGLNNYQVPYSKTDIGDLSLMLGWQFTDQNDPSFLEYYSFALRAGVLVPSGSKDNTSYVFSAPTGHNEHLGIPARIDFMFGLTHWIQVGAHGGATFFTDKTLNRRMKTNENQSGFLRLAQGNASIDRGTQWDAGAYAKFENVFKGFSAIAGYSYSRKGGDELSPSNSSLFSSSVVSGDSNYSKWETHVIHLALEYDSNYRHVDQDYSYSTRQSKQEKPTGIKKIASSIFGDDNPNRLKPQKYSFNARIYHDFPIDGKRIFATDMLGGGIGTEMRWNF